MHVSGTTATHGDRADRRHGSRRPDALRDRQDRRRAAVARGEARGRRPHARVRDAHWPTGRPWRAPTASASVTSSPPTRSSPRRSSATSTSSKSKPRRRCRPRDAVREDPARHLRDHARRRRARRLAAGGLPGPAGVPRDAARAPPRSPKGRSLGRTLHQPRARQSRHGGARSGRRDGERPLRAHPDGRPDASRRGGAAQAHSLRQQAARGHLLGLARGPERPPPRRRRSDRPRLDPLRGDGVRHRFRGPAGAAAGAPLRRPHRHGRKRLGRARRDPGTDRRPARRGTARPRVQGALDSAGIFERRLPNGEGRPAHLAEGRIHADRPSQRRRQLHRDAVSAESGRRELSGPDDARGRRGALPSAGSPTRFPSCRA